MKYDSSIYVHTRDLPITRTLIRYLSKYSTTFFDSSTWYFNYSCWRLMLHSHLFSVYISVTVNHIKQYYILVNLAIELFCNNLNKDDKTIQM